MCNTMDQTVGSENKFLNIAVTVVGFVHNIALINDSVLIEMANSMAIIGGGATERTVEIRTCTTTELRVMSASVVHHILLYSGPRYHENRSALIELRHLGISTPAS